jgi:hypothetical protein
MVQIHTRQSLWLMLPRLNSEIAYGRIRGREAERMFAVRRVKQRVMVVARVRR